jgi:hypothetical protein
MCALHYQREVTWRFISKMLGSTKLAEAIASIEPCPFTGKVTADQVKLVLGEKVNIWPLSILPDALKEVA